MAHSDLSFPVFVDRVVEFPDGASYELLQPLTDFRSCHDGSPAEARILFECKRLWHGSEQVEDDGFIMKVKIQEPDNSLTTSQKPEVGPSTTTSAEIKALGLFCKAQNPYVPQLIAWKRAVQGDDGPLPGGFLTYTVMTKLPGETLFKLRFWALSEEERGEIIRKFLPALRSIYALGIEPTDRGLRNILWDQQTRRCSIIDFEMWLETSDMITDETRELQRWGLSRPPPPRNWWEAWKMQY